MAELIVHQEKIPDLSKITDLCPFGAIEVNADRVNISAACRMCKLCVKNGPPGAFEFVEAQRTSIDKNAWRGVAVYIDQTDGEIHPGETVEEKISLSERFGLWISFYPYSQGEALAIVAQWLRHFGVAEGAIEAARPHALVWALERGSRSGRVAYQFARDYAGREAA